MEHLYIVTKAKNGGVEAIGVAEREAAHRLGLKHTTSICALVVADGPEAGRILVHDRYLKLLGKAEARAAKDPAAAQKAEHLREHPLRSLNLFGGHLSAPATQAVGDVCHAIGEEEMRACMLHELEEELALLPGASDAGQKIIHTRRADGPLEAMGVAPCPIDGGKLAYIGYAEYTSPFNEEISSLFALPVALGVAARMVAADNYYDAGGTLVDIALPLSTLSLAEAQAMYSAGPKPDTELCDAFTRLLLEANRDTWERLKAFVAPYQRIGEAARVAGTPEHKAAVQALETALAEAQAALAARKAERNAADEAYSDAHYECEIRAQKELESPFSYAMPPGFVVAEAETLKAAKQAEEAERQAQRLVEKLTDTLRRLRM